MVAVTSIMQHKPPAAKSYGIDLDANIMSAHDDWINDYLCEYVHGDCSAWLKSFDFKTAGRVLIYADPPYLHSTRSSTKRYRHDYIEQDHIQLIELLRSLPAAVMISGYTSDLYDQLLADWRSMEFTAMSRGGVRTEKVWMNFPSGDVYCSTYAGDTFTQRQNIKRKAKGWAAKYRKLRPAERLAIMTALSAEEDIAGNIA